LTVTSRIDLPGDPSAEWLGESWFRVLSYYFSIRWNWPEDIPWLNHILSPFAVEEDPAEDRTPPTPGVPPVYSLLDLGEGEGDRYQLHFSGGTLIERSHRSRVLEHLLWHINSEACRRTGDFLLIHAGAVVSPQGGAILLPGASGSGKTTLVAALVAEGFDYLSDEAAAIDPVTRLVHPFPKALSLKQGSLDLLPSLKKVAGGNVTRGHHVLAEEIRTGSVGVPSPVSAVVGIQRGSETHLVSISQAGAAKLLAENSLNLKTYQGRGLRLIADVVGGVDSYALKIGSLREAVESISRLAEKITDERAAEQR
jgi:hypothetical protein